MYAIKRELKLNNKERTLMARHAGFKRLVYNYGLSILQRIDYQEFPSSVYQKICLIKRIFTNYTKKTT
ncbi:helix-turn-helix domain-containing protein [Nostoc sp. CHAB 5844]|nr:helix-turn-helix domain-containing protein [Nostoc sp. CHAB 5844]